MTEDEQQELALLKLGNDMGKFAIGLDPRSVNPQQQLALERLQMRDWVRLIDVSYISAAHGVCRVFKIMPEASEWLKQRSYN